MKYLGIIIVIIIVLCLSNVFDIYLFTEETSLKSEFLLLSLILYLIYMAIFIILNSTRVSIINN